MITCERCGKQVPDTAAICPACGTISPLSRPSPAGYGQSQPSSISYEYSQGYGQQSVYSSQPDNLSQSGYPSPSNTSPQSAYPAQSDYSSPSQQSYNIPPAMYPPVTVNVVAPLPGSSENTNSGAVVVEVLLNLFLGIYGVGWMMAGETTIGIILLIASLVLYWPIVILGSIFTLGLGLLCIIPLSVGGVILNGILLNNALKRKAMYMLVQTQTPAQPFPRQ